MSEKMGRPPKVGRPKNVRLRVAENKLAKLQQELEDLKMKPITEIDETKLTKTAVAYRFDKEKNLYYLDIFGYDPDTGIAKRKEVRVIGDAKHRALYELEKFIGKLFMEEK